MLISIIIPIYNSEAFLEKCIDSILSQTFKNFELILINDGSTDSSGKIIELYSRKDSRIVVIQKTNSGVSDSRNIGIRSSKGEAICFIDSDDWIDDDYLESFINNFHDHQTLLIQNINRNGEIKENYNYKNYSLETELDALFTDNKLLYSGGPVAKFYSRSIISDYHIFFNGEVNYGEDLIFFLDYIKHIKCIRFLNYAKYHYRHTPGSLSTKKSHPLHNYVIVHSKIQEFIQWANSKDLTALKYFYSVDWDIVEAGIDQNIHLPAVDIKSKIIYLKNSFNKQHFSFANNNRKIIYLLIKTKNLLVLKWYKNILALLMKK